MSRNVIAILTHSFQSVKDERPIRRVRLVSPIRDTHSQLLSSASELPDPQPLTNIETQPPTPALTSSSPSGNTPPSHTLLSLRLHSHSMNPDIMLSDERLSAWASSMQQRYIHTPPSLGSCVSISGSSVEVLAAAVLRLLEHIHCQDQDVTPEAPPDRLPGISYTRPVPLRAFLYDQRFFSLSSSTEIDTLTVGQGLERSVWGRIFTTMAKDHYHWQTIGSYSTPKLSPFRDANDTQASHALWLSYGAACALHLIHSATAPEPVSPFLLLAMILGQENFHKLTFTTVASFDPDLGTKLQPWLELSADSALPEGLNNPVAQLLMEYEIEVRLPVTLYSISCTDSFLTGSASLLQSPISVRSSSVDLFHTGKGSPRRWFNMEPRRVQEVSGGVPAPIRSQEFCSSTLSPAHSQGCF